MEIKLKKLTNIITLIVLTAGLIHSIIKLISELSMGQNILLLFDRFIFLIPYALAAAVIFGAGRFILAMLRKKYERNKIKEKKSEGTWQRKLKIASNVITLTILVVGFGYCLTVYVMHETTCDHCSAHGAYLEIVSMIYGVIVLFSGVFFSISRLVLTLFRRKDSEKKDTIKLVN